MAVFRVEKTKDFTVMSNHHLRNTELSLKAKGLLSLMLSLPEDWDYTTKGLAHICRDGVDSITTALKELERHGYLTRQRLRNENGQLGDIEYTIHEKPVTGVKQGVSPKRENPRQVNPRQAKPEQAEPEQENPAQLNTNPQKTKKSKTDISRTHQSIYPEEPETAGCQDGIDRMDMAEAYRGIIKVALSGEPEERRLLWMSRPCGTYCLSEREVYLQESNENKVWMFYHEQTNDPILAYALTLDGLQDGKVTGTIYPLDYPSHVERVKSLSCPIDRVTVTFEDGVQFTLPYQSRRRQINELMPEHGTPKSMQYAPESERELAVILRRERLKRDYHAKPGNVQEYMEKLKKASMRGRLKEAQAAVAAPGRGAPHKGGLDR